MAQQFGNVLSAHAGFADMARQRLQAQGDREEAALLYRLWDLVMADLDQIAAAVADSLSCCLSVACESGIYIIEFLFLCGDTAGLFPAL